MFVDIFQKIAERDLCHDKIRHSSKHIYQQNDSIIPKLDTEWEKNNYIYMYMYFNKILLM